MIERKSKRWGEEDTSVYYCEACESHHYKYSAIGRKHWKFRKEIEGEAK